MKLNEMKTRQDVINWASNLLNHHYMHQEDSKPREAITVDPQDMVKLIIFLTTEQFGINRRSSDER
jgi:hypothetical protein